MERLRRKRFSKKGKKNWRKHIDAKDLEDYLEGRRREGIFGVPASEKPDKDLFFIQKDVSIDAVPTANVKRTRCDIRRQPLKSEINLQPNPTIKGFPTQKRKIAKKNRTFSKESQDQSSSDEEEFDTSASYNLISREVSDRLAAYKKQHPEKSTVHVASRDLWDDESGEDSMNDEHYLRVTRKKKIKKPCTMKEVSSRLKSVDIPHPGMSYNPTFEDHQDLLHEAVNVEKLKLRVAQRLERKLQMAKMTHQEREKVWLEEMSEGVLGGKEERECEKEDEEGFVPRKPPVRAEDRKTKKQRRREHLRMKEEIRRRFAKANKVKMDEIYRLRSIKKEIKQRESAISEKQAKTLELKRQSIYTTKRLGRHLYEEPAIPVQLSSEVTGSLRTLKPEGNIAMERFKSLQKRNIIEPRELVRPHRKYKLLIKEKRSCKLPEDKN